VAANGYIYVGSADHKLYQINTTTHKKIWFDTHNPIYSSPAVDSGIVYLTTYTAQLYTLDAISFKVKWSAVIGNTKIGNVNESAPIVASEVIKGASTSVVYVGSNDHNLYAFNASGCGNSVCTPLWKAPTGNAIYSSPAVATEVINSTSTSVVYVGSNDGNLYAFNASTGAQIWSFSTGGAIVASPTVVNGVVYVGSTDSKFYAVDATTGTELWYYTTGNEIFSSAAVTNRVAYVGSYDHKLYAFTIANCGSNGQVCQPTWMAPTGGYISSSPAVANDVVYVGSYDHKLYAFDANGCGSGNTTSTCSPLRTVSTGGPIKSSPVVINGVVYVGSYDYKFYAFH